MQWTADDLEPLRQLADPEADAIIARVAESGIVEETNQLLHSIITNRQEVPPGLPHYLYDWMNRACQLPDWVDPARIREANAFFREDGPSISLFACTTGFLWLYACPKGSAVLQASRRLVEDTQRRVGETAQFLLEVCNPGGLSPEGGGVRMIQKVRLMHSSIRWFLTHNGRWDQASLGAPINQEDMLGTALCLGYQIIEDMQTMGIKMPRHAIDDWWYLWRAVAEMLGVQRDFIPVTRDEAGAAMRAIIGHQMGPSEAGRTLTKALIEFHADVVPGEMMDGTIPALIRKAMGDEIGDMLGVPHSKWEKVLGRTGFRTVNLLDRVSGPFGSLVERMSLSFINGKSRTMLGREPAAFAMPENLRSAWQRKAARVIDVWEEAWADGVLDQQERVALEHMQQQMQLTDDQMMSMAVMGAIDAAVADGVVEPHEMVLVERVARHRGLGDAEVARIHHMMSDGVIDAAEREHLHQMLGLVG